MAKTEFTAARVAEHRCPAEKGQAFIWDSLAPGLGLRATPRGDKAYIFQSKLNGKTIRIGIGSPKTWTIKAAQIEARRLQTIMDAGRDPRQVQADGLAAEQDARDARKLAIAAAEAAASAAAIAEQRRIASESVTLGDVWPKYIEDRAPHWGQHHLRAHSGVMQAGGEVRKRSQKLTTAGPLALFAPIPLIDITPSRIEAWAKVEAKVRPASARLSLRMLNACLTWCAEHATYGQIVSGNAAKGKKVRETLGKPVERNDVLEREQLSTWFEAVRQISNPVISAYLQSLLLVGPRREELAELRWVDVDFRWNKIKLKDKIEDFRMVPLTPYVAHLLKQLPRRNEFVFSSPAAAAGYLAEPRHAHNEALQVAGLPHLTLHGLRRSFATLCEWIEVPAGISAQIQGHAPQGVREQKYIRRPLDLLRMWHVKIEAWILHEAGIEFQPAPAGLHVVATA